ncbi:MAG: DUF6125 family protein [Promethearchaeota archaeon]
MKVSKEDKLFYFERNFFTLDGLWIIETEKETDLDTSIKVDLAVWKRFVPIIYQRIKKYLGYDEINIPEMIDIITFRWACEGWDFKIIKREQNEGEIHVLKCPYRDIMDRNPERRPVIPRICKEICDPIYDEAISKLNPGIKLTRHEHIGLGGKFCDFKLERKD